MISCNAVLLNVGKGTLEITGDILLFTVKKGFFEKRQEIVREIYLKNIRNVKLYEKYLSIMWLSGEEEEVTDIFVIEETEQLQRIYQVIMHIIEEQKRMLASKEEAKQKSKEISRILQVAMGITDSLFDILRNLHGRIKWNTIDTHLRLLEENIKNFKSQIISTVNMDLTRLSLAIKERSVEETVKETYGILNSLYEYFIGLASITDEFLKEIHLNFQDAKAVISAYYTLNDIILGIIVEDEEIEEEVKRLEIMLNDLLARSYFKVNSKALKDAVNKLATEGEKQGIIEEIRAIFRQPLIESTL